MKHLSAIVALWLLWSGLPALPSARAATPCKQWGTGKFFRQATPADVRACVDQGADANGPERKGRRPIHRAAEYAKDPQVVAALLEAGADPNVHTCCKYSLTPLHLATSSNMNRAARPGIVRALLAGRADPNARDILGMTPLHSMFSYRFDSPRLETAKALIEAGARPNIRNNKGVTALDMAYKEEIRSYLASVGAKRSPPKQNSGSGILGQIVAGAIAGTTAVAAGANTEEAARVAESVMTGRVPPPSPDTAGTVSADIPDPESSAQAGTDGGGGTSQEEIDRRLREQERKRQEERAQQRREDAVRRQIEIRKANARILGSDCRCIRIEDDGEYVCLDGFVVGNNSRNGLMCDIRR